MIKNMVLKYIRKQRVGSSLNKKAFTLIELLAVIVILAIVALIATPQIMNVINDAKKGAFESSSYGIIKAAEQGYSQAMIKTNNVEATEYEYVNGNKNLKQGNIEINYKGSSPKSGTILINNQGQVAVALYSDGYCITKSYNESDIQVDKKEECNIRINGYDETKGVNEPVIVSGMTPIKWDSNNNEIETNVNDPEWYDYNNHKWANVKTEDGSYFVWIPRYAYKITSNYHSTTTGTIDVKFLKGTSNITQDKTKIETSGYNVEAKNTSTNYFLHPAFNFDGDALGYWVAKYEPTAAEGVVSGVDSCNAADNVSTKTVKIVPNATSWRCINIKNAYTVSLNMKDKTEVYGWNSNKVDTHMMKNSEWGAVSYLSKSQYGADTLEVWNNAYNQYKTGCSGSSVSAANEATCIEYNTENGVKASTTHNIYGIYDMSGGTNERTMALYNNLQASSGFTSNEVETMNNKYIDRYSTPTVDLLNGVGMDYDTNNYGDGVYETSNNARRYNGSEWIGSGLSWYSDAINLPYVSTPWFHRGATFGGTSNAGVFAISHTTGSAHISLSFRPVVFTK